jgi:ACS family hexuronate transporter-like MFS transporter
VSQPDHDAAGVEKQSDRLRRPNAWAWGICWLMFASTILNYMDRQAIAIVRPQIKDAFAIATDKDFGWVLAAFMMTYALFQVPAGYLVDLYDLRRSYAAAVAWWSTAAVATALVPSLGMLIVCRVLLGVGESFNWPCALRVTGRVLPPADRSLGNGIFNSGAAVGAVVTPIAVAYLVHVSGWRAAFLVIGAAGFIWVAAWLILVQGENRRLLAKIDRKSKKPADELLDFNDRRLSQMARFAFGAVFTASIAVALSAFRYGQEAIWLGIALAMLGTLAVAALLPIKELTGADWATSLGEVVRHRRFWILVVVSVSINICWHFLINWTPTYLKDERGLTFETSSYLSAIPFLAADGGNLGGGWLSRKLASLGMSTTRARLLVMSFCTLLILVGTGISVARDHTTAVLILSIMAAGTAAFMANYFAFCQEVSLRHTGLVVGYLGGVGNLFVARFQPFAGFVKDRTGSFSLIFLLIGLAPLVGLAALYWGWNDQGHGEVEPDAR